MVFVNSMSDLFHEKVPLAFVRQIWKVMAQAHWHTFQILTKRPDGWPCYARTFLCSTTCGLD